MRRSELRDQLAWAADVGQQHRSWAQRQAIECDAMNGRITAKQEREAIVQSVLRWLHMFFGEHQDLTDHYPSDADRRALAEAVASLILAGGA